MEGKMIWVLLVMACPIAPPPRPDCVAVVAEVESVAGCRDLYQEIKATLPAGLSLGFPECVRGRR
jgi:hypothetical protein